MEFAIGGPEVESEVESRQPGSAERAARRRLERALFLHDAELRAHGIDPGPLLALCDPRELARLALTTLDTAADAVADGRPPLPAHARIMLERVFALRERLPQHLLTAAPAAAASTGAAAAGSSTNAKPLVPPALFGIYIVWKDLDKTLWPSALQIIPELLLAALNAALALITRNTQVDGAVYWQIQPMINRSAMVLEAVVLVVPPVIVPNFAPPAGMMAVQLTRYEENLELIGRLFLLGVPLNGRVVLHPVLKQGPTGGSSPASLVASGRVLTATALLTPTGFQNAVTDAKTALEQLGANLLQKGMQGLTTAVTGYLMEGLKEGISALLDQLSLEPYLESLVGEIDDCFKWLRDHGVAELGQADATARLAWLGAPNQDAASLEQVKNAVASDMTSLSASLTSSFEGAAFSLATLGVATQVKGKPSAATAGGATTLTLKQGTIDDGFGRAIQPGWIIQVGDQLGTVTSVKPPPQPAGQSGQPAGQQSGPYQVTVTPIGTAGAAPVDGAPVLAYPPDIEGTATNGDSQNFASFANAWMFLNMAAQRGAQYGSTATYNALVGDAVTSWQSAILQPTPQAQYTQMGQSFDQVMNDYVAKSFGAPDYNQMLNGTIDRDVIRPIAVQRPDAVTVVHGAATWTFQSGFFTQDDVGRSLHVAGTANTLDSGDFVINKLIDASTVTTDDGSQGGTMPSSVLGSESFDPAKVAVQVVTISTGSVTTTAEYEAKAIAAVTSWITKEVNSLAISAGNKLVQEISAKAFDVGKLDQVAARLGGTGPTDAITNAATVLGTDVGSVIKAGNLFDMNRTYAQIGTDLQTAGTKLLDDLEQQAESVGTGVALEVLARLFVFTCIAGFDVQGGLADEGGGYLGDWSGTVFVGNRVEGCRAEETGGSGGNGGGILLRGAFPNVFLLNDIDGNIADERGGGLYADTASWPVLVWNEFSGNSAHSGGGADFSKGSLPIAAFNTFKGNTATGNPSGIGGGVRCEAGAGFVLANSLTGNHATMHGGGIYHDGGAWVCFNRIDGNAADKLGGGVYAASGGEFGLNSIDGNRAVQGGGVATAGAPDFSANHIGGNEASASGGGVAVLAGSGPSFSDVIAGNASPIGGGVYVDPAAKVDLAGSSIAANTATRDGGGLYLDGVANTPPFGIVGGVYIAANAAGGSGAGVFAARDVELAATALIGNEAGVEGGGLFAANRQRVGLSGCVVYGNIAPQGGGLSLRGGGTLALSGNALRFNIATAGEGGAVLAQSVQTVSSSADLLSRNQTRGYNGAGWCVRDAATLTLGGGSFLQNITSGPNDGVRTPQAGGGGVFAQRVAKVTATSCIAAINGAELGGAFGFDDCASVEVQSCNFSANIADQDRDGNGQGGAIYATGAGSTVHVGGDATTSAPNIFDGNSAGAPGTGSSSTAIANGGAIAIVDGAVGIVEGNQFSHNAATCDGGAIYFGRVGAGSRIGGTNGALPQVGAGRRFGNQVVDNCYAMRLQSQPPVCCTHTPGITEQPGGSTTTTTITETATGERTDGPPPTTTTDNPPPPPTTTTENPPPPCIPWVTYEPDTFTQPDIPVRAAMLRRVEWVKPVQSAITSAFDQLPLADQALLFLAAPGIDTDFDVYTLWPANQAQTDRFDVATAGSAFLDGWAPVGDFQPQNVGQSGYGFAGGTATINDAIDSVVLGPIVSRRGSAFAIVGGDGTQVAGNLFSHNYAAQFGGAGLVDGADKRTQIGPPSATVAFGRNDFVGNLATFGGALALVGGTSAQVTWNAIGGAPAQANYATGGGGVFVWASAPTIGGATASETTEVIANVAGHRVAGEDAGIAPQLLIDCLAAGLVGFGGGVAVLGPSSAPGARFQHVPIQQNLVLGPALFADVAAGAGAKSSGPPAIARGSSPAATYLIGGGAALLAGCRATLDTCDVASNEIVAAILPPAGPNATLCLAGGGVAVGFDPGVVPVVAAPASPVLVRALIPRVSYAKPALRTAPTPVPVAPIATTPVLPIVRRPIITVPLATPAQQLGATIVNARVENNRLRIPTGATPGGTRELLGGGVALLEAQQPEIVSTFIGGNLALREPAPPPIAGAPPPPPPPPATFSLHGGGLAVRGSQDALVLETRIERNQLPDPDKPQAAEGGGGWVTGSSLSIDRSWLVRNYSHRDGGGLYALGPAAVQVTETTFADNEALSRGGALFADGALTGSAVASSIFDFYGSWDAAAVHGGKQLAGLRITGCCLWAPLGLTFGGALTAASATGTIEADPGYAEPDRAVEADYSLRAASPCLAGGKAIGWNPWPSALAYRSTIIAAPSATHATLASALAAAQPGDIVEVAPGRYAERLTVPDGIIVRTTGGPDQTTLALPLPLPVPPVPRTLVTLAPGRRRSAFAGFTIEGLLPNTLLAANQFADLGIAVAAEHQGNLTRLVVQHCKTGIDVAATPAPVAHPPWIGGATVVHCLDIGIHLAALEFGAAVPPLVDPCRSPRPPTHAVVLPPVCATLEHNVVARCTGVGIRVDAGSAQPATRAGFEDLAADGTPQSGYVAQMIQQNDNTVADPLFRDATTDFHPTAGGLSPALPANTSDGRALGALPGR